MTKLLANYEIKSKSCAVEQIVLFNSKRICLGVISLNDTNGLTNTWEGANGKCINALISANDHATFTKQFAKAKATGHSEPFCVNVITLNGVVSVQGQLKQLNIITAKDKAIAWHLFSSTSVNAPPQDNELHLYHKFISGIAVPMFIFEPATNKIIFTNSSAQQLLGLPENEINDTAHATMGQLISLQIKGSVDKIISNKSCTIYQNYVKPNGSIVKVEVHATPFKIGCKAYILGAINDITYQKQLDFRLKQTLKFFENLFQENTLPLILVNQENLNILQANNQALDLLDININENSNIKLSSFSDLSEKQFKLTIESFVQKRYTGLELTINTKYFGKRDIAFHYSFIGNEMLPQILFALVDVSDRNNSIREVSKSKENLSAEVKRQTADLMRINNSLVETINKSKKIEAALRQSEEMFFRLFQSNPNGMVLRHLDTLEIFEANNSFLKVFNLNKCDVIGSKIEDLGIHCKPKKYAETLSQLIEKKSFRDLDIVMTSKQGHTRFVLYSGEVITLERKEFVLEVFQDVTNFQITQQKLVESEERYRSMFNNALVGFYRTEIASGIVLDCNMQFAKILGYNNPSDIISRSLTLHYMSERDRETFLCQLKKKKVLVYEHSLKTNDEKKVWIVNYAQIFPNYGFIEGVAVDITDRKLMEDMLTYSETKFRSMIENATDLIIIIDSEANGLYFSPSIMRELGYNTEFTKKANILNFLDSNDRAIIQELLAKKLIDKKTLEVKVKHANGSFRFFEFVITNLLNDPSINGYVINARDITHQIKARNEIDIALLKEQELSRLKTQFIATVSHEFRTPLTNISLNIQLLEKYIHDRNFEKTESSLERMNNAIKRLVALLNEVSLISKDQSGRLQFSPSDISTYSLIDELIDQQSYLLLPYIEVTVNKGDQRDILVDKNLLSHILGNLINNAVKYSPEKNPIQVSISNINNNLEMKVVDNGIGIPKEELRYLFDPYFRASNVSQISGTGLGLSIVKKCIDLHNGTIEVVSEPNKGTEITCTIPLNFCE